VTILNDIQRQLAKQLLISVIKKEPTIYYHELADRVVPKINPRNVGKHIGEVSKLCYELGLPLLSAKVINAQTQVAGEGFYPLYEELKIKTDGLSEKELCHRELKKIRECTEWYKLSDYLHLELDLPRAIKENKEIRILPMSKDLEFKGMPYEEIQQQFFIDQLSINGIYRYRGSGMNCPEGSLVLFQIGSEIIASAIMSHVYKYDEPEDGIYYGEYVFDAESIEVFRPITADELARLDNNFLGFSRVKQRLSYEILPELISLIKAKQIVSIPEELPIKDAPNFVEGAKRQITVNAYERNETARNECIRIHGASCKICGFDFGKFYGEDFNGKIHVHHIKPLSEINDEYVVDPENDLIPVCPNCHAAIHSKPSGVYSIDEIIIKINRNK
jgi:hypothetical protein